MNLKFEELFFYLFSPFLERPKPRLLCPRCDAEIDPTDEFCLECGKLLLLDEAYDAINDEQD